MLKQSICILLALAAAGCAGGSPTVEPGSPPPANRQPVPPTDVNPSLTPDRASPTSPRTATPPPKANAQATALPTIPAGARFSIFCESYNGPDHVKFATELKNLLAKNSQLKDWYVIHQAGQSSLYHGYYTEFDPKAAGTDRDIKRDAERAQRDHELVESIPNPQAPSSKLFPRSLFVPLDAPDPDAPPAWNLTNAPGFWTVQVAAFTGTDRKRQTVEAVKQAREMNVPAFYYHGENISSVCVGSWDRGAVKEQGVARPGDLDLDPNARDDDKPYVVNYTPQEINMGADKKMRQYQSKIEILDASLMETLKQYPAQAVDGREVPLTGTDKVTGQKVTRPRPSMIVMIPRAEKNVAAGGAQTNEPDASLIAPNRRGSDLGSRLRGIGQ